ncbi:hypothetical protein HYG86_05230 [Alkalicella caledoniensis]|uniref:Uncharacterized protein n=1 Tax=Alkalicella caledoniensis TaxID=2731377 RepID=A0A7G9W6A3_ALKCA|nr:DUF6544 family protein [Alkalicella caledoniensis]QNO14215.1 hypothetical protein HYG86_05230 [Alkalicella caledoniensis]
MLKIENIRGGILKPWLIIIIAIVILIIIVFSVGKRQMSKRIDTEIGNLIKDIETFDRKITHQDLEELPEPVQKWLEKVGVVGKEHIQSVHFMQTGKMRLNPDQSWMVPQAEQYVNVQNPGYLWHVDLPMMPILNTKGKDLFFEGNGQMEVRIGHLIPVVNEKSNYKLNESSLGRFLLELPLYPTASLNDYISWEDIDKNSAKAIMKYKGLESSATLLFDDSGSILSIEAMRFKDTDENAKRLKCVGTIVEQKEFEGFIVPTKIDISWQLEEGEFTWFQVEIYDVKFNIH